MPEGCCCRISYTEGGHDYLFCTCLTSAIHARSLSQNRTGAGLESSQAARVRVFPLPPSPSSTQDVLWVSLPQLHQRPQLTSHSTSGFSFGAHPSSQPAASTSLFGASQPAPSLFAAPATPASSSLFSTSSSAPSSGGLFGAAPAAAASKPLFSFGTPAASAAPAAGGLFGASQPAAGGGLFGQTQPAAGGSLFAGLGAQPGGSLLGCV